MTLILLLVLCGLVLLSGFFSASETAILSINRFRLRHLAYQQGHRAAKRICRLLEKPDQLLSVILIGNTMANIFASAVATLLSIHFGDWGVAISTILLTLIVLVFAELTPKTLAAMHAESVAFAVALPLTILLKIIYPIVFLSSWTARQLLILFGVPVTTNLPREQLNTDELRSIVHESAGHIPVKHQSMLLGVLDLVKVTVDDIMIPRNEIIAINLNDDPDDLHEQLSTCQYTRLPVYDHDIEKLLGILHVRDAVMLMAEEALSIEKIKSVLTPVHYVLEGTPLNRQLLNFQKNQARLGIVVDEYARILGLVTLEDILEEIVGEFTSDVANVGRDIHPQDDGSYIVEGSISLRKLNRMMSWNFSTDGPKTLNGLILEQLQAIPRTGTCVLINSYPIEVIHVSDNRVKTARIYSRRIKGKAS